MADIVNLRQMRKRVRRRQREERAEENRALHAIPARQRKAASAERQHEERRLDSHRREAPSAGSDGPRRGR